MANSLEKTISQLNIVTESAIRAKTTLESLIQQMMKNPSSSVQMNYADELNHIIALEEKRISLVREYNRLMAQRRGTTAAETTPAGYVAGGAPGVASAENTAAFNDLTGGGAPTPAEVRAKQQAARQAAIKAAEDQRQAYIKSEANAREMAEMAKLGYTDPQTQFKYNRNVPGGAYSVSRWQRTDPDSGKQYRTDARIDPRGNVAQGAIPRQNQSFAQGIGKDIGDLLKWSVAIAAIYGPINAMSEAMTQLIENESKLADVSIALNPEVADTGKVFEDVNTAARASGESISGVIDAFGAAYTAAGRITDGTQRYAATIKLLDDSLVLSKLSTLDQAGAIDVLTSALYQTGDANADAAEKLSRGRDLIDQWIQVSKIASVSVETLATGVAVLGDSAETAGLTLEQLNALVATLSETSLSSGKETANIAKALIGNYQQESAVKELNRLGIAVVDTTGKTRQFLDVMKDVAAMRSQGLLGDQDFSRLTLALGGGGIRRQKDVSAFIENFGRMEQIAGMQGGAEGSSADAMAKKLETVQTASTNLGNAFTNLAQTLGDEGGLLDTMSGTINFGTKLIDVFDRISASVGKVGPLLMAAGVSMALLGRGGLQGATNKLGTNFTIPIAERLGASTGSGMMAAQLMTGQMRAPGRLGNLANLPSLAAIGLPAAQNFASGDTAEAGANIAGGIVGALVAGPVGALVGTAIAEAFVRKTITYESSFADLFAGSIKKSMGAEGGWGTGSTKSLDELNKDAFKEVGGGNEQWGRFVSFIGKQLSNPDVIGGLLGKQIADVSGGEFKTEGAAALNYIKRNNPELYKTLSAEYAQEGGVPEGTNTRLTQRQKELSTPETMNYLRQLQSDEQNRLQKELITGKIKPSDYANRLSSTSAFSTTAPRYLAAMEDQVGGVGDAFSSTEEAYKAFLEILSSGNQEAINSVNSHISTLDALQNVMDNLNGQTTDIKFTVNGQEITGGLKDLQNAIANETSATAFAAKDAAQQAMLKDLTARDVYGSNITAAPTKDVSTVIADTLKLQDRKYNDVDPAIYTAMKESWEPFYVLVEEAGKVFYRQVTDAAGNSVDKNLFGEAYKAAQDSGKVSSDMGSGIGWSVGSATAAQYRDAESRAPAFTKMLEDKGYKSKIEDAIVTTSDKQTIVSHGDQKVIQYLLQQILDTEKKQLQGVWNLPEGSSFWVPLQSMIDGGGGSGTGTGGYTDDGKVAKETVAGTPGEELSMYGTTIKELIDAAKPVAKMTKEDYLNQFSSARGATSRSGIYEPTKEPISKPMEPVSGIEQMMNLIKSLFSPFGQLGGTGLGSGYGGMSTGGVKGGKNFSPSDNSQAVTQTRMDIKFTSTMNLMVDGRVLASIVKPYLASDLMKTNESGGTVTRAYVI